MKHIMPVVVLQRFLLVTHTYATSFSSFSTFFETNNIFILKTREKYARSLIVSERTLKIKAVLPFLLILLTSGVMIRQKNLHGNKIVQHFQNEKVQLWKNNFESPLKSSRRYMKIKHPQTARTSLGR